MVDVRLELDLCLVRDSGSDSASQDVSITRQWMGDTVNGAGLRTMRRIASGGPWSGLYSKCTRARGGRRRECELKRPARICDTSRRMRGGSMKSRERSNDGVRTESVRM